MDDEDHYSLNFNEFETRKTIPPQSSRGWNSYTCCKLLLMATALDDVAELLILICTVFTVNVPFWL